MRTSLAIFVSLSLPTAFAADCPIFPGLKFAAGQHPISVAIGDLNGDGKPDLAAANNASNDLSILFGDGAGGFSLAASLPAGNGPSAVEIADLDNDGIRDLVVASGQSNKVRVYRGLGGGAFAAAVGFVVGLGPVWIAVGDLNGDAQPDLAVANGTASSVSLLFGTGGTGAAAFAPAVTLPMAYQTKAVAIGDLNGDAKPDLAIATNIDKVVVRYGNGLGDFTPSATFAADSGVNALVIADLNGDGARDIATSCGTGASVAVLINDGTGSFSAPLIIHLSTGLFGMPRSIVAGDWNGDGKMDLAVAEIAPRVALLMGNGVGGFAPHVDLMVGPACADLAAGDLDADGVLDLVVADAQSIGSSTPSPGSLSVLRGDGHGGFLGTVTIPAISNPYETAVDDLNGDGKPDIAVAGEKGVAILFANGSGGFSPPSLYQAGAVPRSIAIGDWNGDKKKDVLIANSGSNDITILQGDGAGSFTPGVSLAGGTGPSHIAVADVNGDGKLDVVVVRTGTALVGVILGNGLGGVISITNVEPGQATSSYVAIGDVNHDAKLDLVVTNPNSDRVSIMLGNGTGGFQTLQNFPTGGNPRAVVIGDFNRDGNQDLAIAAAVSNQISVLIGDGSGNFAGPTNFAAGFTPIAIACADANGDGNLDLATSTLDSQDVSLLFGNGAGGFAPAIPFDGGAGLSIQFADLNGDGRPEVVVPQSLDSVVGFLPNLGCPGSSIFAYGTGCAGSGGFVPVLTLSCCASPGQPVTLSLEKGVGGANALLLFGLAPASVALPGKPGCSLLVAPLLPLVLNLPLSGVGPGNGSFSYATTIPAGAPVATFAMQAFVLDAGASHGYATSAGLVVHVE